MEAVVITTGVKHSCQNPWSVTIMDPNQENGRVELKVMCPKVNPLTVCAQNVPISIGKNNIIDLIFLKYSTVPVQWASLHYYELMVEIISKLAKVVQGF